jgi:hypothetical protein
MINVTSIFYFKIKIYPYFSYLNLSIYMAFVHLNYLRYLKDFCRQLNPMEATSYKKIARHLIHLSVFQNQIN